MQVDFLNSQEYNKSGLFCILADYNVMKNMYIDLVRQTMLKND